jgi:hypothetical protein
MRAGKTVKSAQSGFDVALPPTVVAWVRVLSTFGDSETSEGAVCEVASGAVNPAEVKSLYVAEAPKGGQP